MILQYLQYLACIMTIVAGLFALLSPARAISLTGLVPQGGRGLTEIRCVMGALYIAVGSTRFSWVMSPSKCWELDILRSALYAWFRSTLTSQAHSPTG